MQCNHINPDDSKCILVTKNEFCAFHTKLDSKGRVSDRRFLALIRRLINNNHTDFRGFIFPRKFCVRDFTIPWSIDVSYASFHVLSIERLAFEAEVKCVNAEFSQPVIINNCRFSRASFTRSIFQDATEIRNAFVSNELNLDYCKFMGRFEISGSIEGNAVFSNSFFNARTIFSMQRIHSVSGSAVLTVAASAMATSGIGGNRSVWQKIIENFYYFFHLIKSTYARVTNKTISTLNKLRVKTKRFIVENYKNVRNRFAYKQDGVYEKHLFTGSANLSYIIFEKPKLVLFRSVDLRRCSFEATDLRGVHFLDCDWFQPELGRNGINAEHANDSSDFHARRLFLPRIESTCRNIRHALEENKDYILANDFFVGEMEAKRKQLGFFKRTIFSVLAWYKAISEYGTSPGLCFRFIMYTAIIHSLILYYFADGIKHAGFHGSNKVDFLLLASAVKYELDVYFDFFIYSLQTMTLQRDKIFDLASVFNDVPGFVRVLNFSVSILGPFLGVLLGLCIRTKIKRS